MEMRSTVQPGPDPLGKRLAGLISELGKAVPSEVTSWSAGQLARAIAARELTAVEATSAHIHRIEEVDGALNAVVVRRFDEALAEAHEADAVIERGGHTGPLHGVPITVKEQFRVQGTATSVGMVGRVEVASAEGKLVTRLRQGGAIILGKTNIAQGLVFHESDNARYGRTDNPWDLARTPGGSSGGQAAVVAAGGSPLGLGADFGGSLRVPAHFCGIHGLRPTTGRFPRTDTPAWVFGGEEPITDQPGPLARTIEDLDLALRVLAEPAIRDQGRPPPYVGAWTPGMESIRVGVYENDGFFPASPAIRRAVREASVALSDAGCRVVDFRPPDVEQAMRLYLGVVGGDGAAVRELLAGERAAAQIRGLITVAGLPNALRPAIAQVARALGQPRSVVSITSLGRRSAERRRRVLTLVQEYRDRFAAALDTAGVDVLVTPPYGVAAFPHGAGDQLHVASAGSYASLVNVLGYPAGVVATTRVLPGEESDRGQTRDLVDRAAHRAELGSVGLPVAVQVVARLWREDLVLSVMRAIEASVRERADYPQTPIDPRITSS